MKFLFLAILALQLPLLAAPMPGNTYIGLQYRNEDLQWTTRQRPTNQLLAQAHWKQIQAAELRLGAQIYPFQCTSRQLSPQVNAFLNTLSLCATGGVLLHSRCQRFNFSFEDDMDGQLQRQLVKGKTSRINGGDASIFLLQQCTPLYNCTVLLSWGYSVQNRTLNTPMHTHNFCDGVYDIDKLGYNTYWHGPWLGVGATCVLDAAWKLFADFEYSRALWRGNNTFKSLETLSDGFCFKKSTKITQKGILNGYKLKLGTTYAINSCLTLLFDAKMELFQSSSGHAAMHTRQKLHHAAGHLIGNTKISQPARAYMLWKSWALACGLSYNF